MSFCTRNGEASQTLRELIRGQSQSRPEARQSDKDQTTVYPSVSMVETLIQS